MIARKTVLVLVAALLVVAVLALPQTSPSVKANPGGQAWYLTDFVSGVSGADYRMIGGSGDGTSQWLTILAGYSRVWVAASSLSADERSNIVCRMSGIWWVTIRANGVSRWQSTLTVDIGVFATGSPGNFTSKGNSGTITLSSGWADYTFGVTTSDHAVNPGEYLAIRVNATGSGNVGLDVSGVTNSPCYVISPSTADDYPGTVNINFTVIDYGSAGINFGSLDPGAVDQPEAAQGPSLGAVALVIGADTNVNIDIQIRGTDFTSGGNTIAIGNVKYNNTDSPGGTSTLTTSYVTWYSVSANTADTRQCYHWISIPAGKVAGSYTSTFSYQAVQQ
jgi:hypothetical protein